MYRNVIETGSRLCTCVLTQLSKQRFPIVNHEQRRNTMIVERYYTPLLAKRGQKRRLRKRDKVYKIVERVHSKPTPDIQCILTEYVDDVGDKGDLVTVKRKLFRNVLYPGLKAIYASPENIEEFSRKDTDSTPRLGPFAKTTARQMAGMWLRIPMSGDNLWVLNKTHVRIAFRQLGVEVREDCIILPAEDITEPQDIQLSVIINKLVTVNLNARIYHLYKDATKNIDIDLPEIWTSPEARKLER